LFFGESGSDSNSLTLLPKRLRSDPMILQKAIES
jgi:hypothetical protein